MLGIQGDSMFSRQQPMETYSNAGLGLSRQCSQLLEH